MGTITVNVDDETENKFRKAVSKSLGTGKGKLGKAIKEAMSKWAEEKEHKEIAERQIRLMEKGFKLGKMAYKHRDELYDRGL